MSMVCSTGSILRCWCISGFPVSYRLDRQFGHAHKIICSSHPPSGQLRSLSSLRTGFPKPSHCLHPAKNLFDSLSNPLTDAIALMARGTTVDGRAASALGISCYMRKNLSATQKLHKILSVIPLVGAQTFYLNSLLSLTLKHLLGHFSLRTPGGLTDLEIDQQAVAVLHHCMRPVTKLRLLARPLAYQTAVRIGPRLMGLVAAFFAVKVYPAIAWISLIFVARSILSLGSKALEACPGLDQSSIHRKMIITHQFGLSGLSNHRVEKQSAHLVFHQPLAVLAEYRGIETLFNQFHIQKPAKQKIVAQLLAKLPLAPDRVKRDQQQRFQATCAGDLPSLSAISVSVGSSRTFPFAIGAHASVAIPCARP